MTAEPPAKIVRRAARFMVAANLFVGSEVLLLIVRRDPEPSPDMPLWFGLLSAFAILAFLFISPLMVARELYRGRDRGRYWFRRWASIEFFLGMSLLFRLLPERDEAIRVPLPTFDVCVGAPLHVLEVRPRRRLAKPEVRRLLR